MIEGYHKLHLTWCMPEMEPVAMLAWMFHGIDVYMVDINQKSIKTRSTSKAATFK